MLTIQPAVAGGFSGTLLFDEPFTSNTANGKGDEVLPAIAGGATNGACLTVAGNTTIVPKSCTTSNDLSNGALRLTLPVTSAAGSLFDQTSVPTSQGLSTTFEMHQYNPTVGLTPADGLAFTIAAVDPANPLAPTVTGPTGGALGYSALRSGGLSGLQHAYLGFGFDVFGNFSSNVYEGSNCTDPAYIGNNTKIPGQAVVRGPGQGISGYCGINSTATNTSSPVVQMHGTSRANSLIKVAIGINPTSTDLVDQNGLTIPAGKYILQFTPIGGTLKTLTGTLPTVSPTFYGSGTSAWINANGIPKQLAFGWTASTGSLVDYHEITNAQVYSLSAVPQLSVTQTSYVDPSPAVGAPVSYVVNSGVAAGPDEPLAISVTDTLPTGVKPGSATGTGWVCGVPSGQQITCTNSSGPFTGGSSLPPLTVQGIVITAGLTSAAIAANTVATASSGDSLPGLSTAATPASPTTPPSGVTASPTSGAKAGGNAVTLSGTNISSGTAVQIGTAAEFTTGTVTSFAPCPGNVAAAGCFTASGGTLVISSMPAHSSGAVSLRVVTLGAGSSATYTYTGVPTAPTVGAVAGLTSATVTWSAPADNGGSAVTGYQVTPIRAGVRGTTQSVGSGVLSKAFSGLDPEVSYTFEVVATNVNGSGTPGLSNAVVPYQLASAPTGVSGAASDQAVVLGWTAPADNGGTPVTAYVITPFIAGVAQTALTTPDASTTFVVTALQAGTSYTFTVKAVNAAGTGPSSSASTAVIPNAPPSLSFPPPPSGEVSAPYSTTLTVTGGTGPYGWTVSSGNLPAGLSLAPGTGVLSGTPTTVGSSTASIQVTDAANQTATQSVTIAVIAAPAITPGAPPAGEVGTPYTFAFSAAGGTTPYAWTVSTGTLPAGLTLNPTTGTLSGTPTAAGSNNVTVKVVDALGVADIKAVTLVVASKPSIGTTPPPPGEVGVAYASTYAVTGGTGPFSWFVSVGALPPGLFLNSATGQLTGIPTSAGTTPFTIKVIDAQNQVDVLASAITVVEAPILTFSPPPGGEVSVPYSTNLAVTGGTGPFTWSIDSGTLPAGLSLGGGSGVISGTPTTSGSSTALIRVTDANGSFDTKSATFVIVAKPSIGVGSLPNGVIGVGYSYDFTVAGGTGPFTWSVQAGSVPAGLNLDPSTGTLSGTPSVVGTSTFTAKVTDANGVSASRPSTLRIVAHVAIGGIPPDGEVGAAYSADYTLTGGTGPFAWSISRNALPAGLFLSSSTGQVTGVPTAAGTATFTVHVVDSQAQIANLASSITIAAAPSLSSPTPPGGGVSAPYSYALSVTGGTGPFVWTVDSGILPPGLSLTPDTGVIHGTPTSAGSSTAVIRVTDTFGQSATQAMTIAIASTLSISSGVPPAGEVGAGYAFMFTAAGGSGPFTWSISSGALPPGLSLDPTTGALTGTPTTAGSTNATIRVVDANTVAATQAISVAIAGPPHIATTPPPAGQVGVAYASTFQVVGGTGPFTWSLSAGGLPAGLFLDPTTGQVSGVPSAAGNATFTVRVVDAQNQAATLASTITIAASPSLTFPPLPPGEVSVPYATTLTVIGGTAPYSWTIDSGHLPDGLSLNSSSGEISGTPTAAGSSTAVFRVTDVFNQSATRSATIPIVEGPEISGTPPAGEVGAAYSFGFTVAGGTAPFTWSLSGGTLPLGLTLDTSTGVLSGTPTTAGSTTFTVKAVDADALAATTAATVVVADKPTIGASPPPQGQVSVAYATTYSVTGGTGPYTWSVSVGSLPAGLFLNAGTGAITGIPTAAGSTPFTVRVVDAQNQVATRASSITVVTGPSLSYPPPPGGEVSAPYTTTLTVHGGTAPYTWNIDSGSLPAGLVLAPTTGVVSGTPTVASATTAVIRVTDSNNQSDTESTTIPITAAPSIVSGAPPHAVINAPYSHAFTVTGGTGPFAWSVNVGALPAGLSLDPTSGVLSGTPTAAGSSTFTVKVMDSLSVSATQTVTVRVVLTLAISGVPPDGEVGAAYSASYTLTGGTGPFTWSISRGALPAGLFIDQNTGQITGIPSAPGTSAFTVHVVESNGQLANLASSITIASGPSFSFPQPPEGEVGVAYSTTLTVSGGTTPYTWSLESGNLPAGLTLDPDTGVVNGTPTIGGLSTSVVAVSDAQGQVGTTPLAITIIAAPTISGTPPEGEIGAPYSFAFSVNGGTGPFAWSITAGALPPGLSLDSATGALSGTPTAAGTAAFTVKVIDSQFVSGLQAVTLTVVTGPVIDPAPPAAGEVGVGYAWTYSVSGGTGPFAWSISAGTLPAGLSLDLSSGAVTGVPTSPGTASFTLRVVDAANRPANIDTAITIAPAPILSYPANIGGQEGVALTVDATLTGGTGPFTFALTAGGLPAGMSLDPATGQLKGTPTVGGVFIPQITVTDSLRVTSTATAHLSIGFTSTISLTASAGLVNLGDHVVLTATVGPSDPTGTVEFDVVPSSGSDAGNVLVVGTAPVLADGKATLTDTASSFGANRYTAIYSGDQSHSAATSATTSVEVAASRGELVVEEMRLFGPLGSDDSYVQLTNLTSVAVPLAGFTVTGTSGSVVTLPPSAPLLRPGHNYLLVGPAFSLTSFASPDLHYAEQLGVGGVRVTAPDTASTVTDAVGSESGFSSGTPLPPMPGPSTVQQAWTRQITFNTVQDTADNLADFNLVSVTGGRITGVQSVLGSPAPAGVADPFRNNSGFASTLLDDGRTIAEPPNRVIIKGVGGHPGTLIVRRTITNRTATTIRAASLRITAISQANGRPPPGQSQQPLKKVNLSLVDPQTATSQVTLSNGNIVTVNNLKVTSVVETSGGGLNSTLAVPLPQGGLPPGQSVMIALTFAAAGPGSFWFTYDADIR